jgi:nucleoid DNA-binding protein
MNKRDLIKQVATEFGLPMNESKAILDWFMNIIKHNLRAWKDVLLPTVWKFTVQETNKRDAYNFKTKTVMPIDSYKSVRFRGSRQFNKTL